MVSKIKHTDQDIQIISDRDKAFTECMHNSILANRSLQKILLSIIDAHPEAGRNRIKRLNQAMEVLVGKTVYDSDKRNSDNDKQALLWMASQCQALKGLSAIDIAQGKESLDSPHDPTPTTLAREAYKQFGNKMHSEYSAVRWLADTFQRNKTKLILEAYFAELEIHSLEYEYNILSEVKELFDRLNIPFATPEKTPL